MEMNCTPETLGTGWTTIQKRFDLNRGVDVFIPVKKPALYFASFPSTGLKFALCSERRVLES